jgi:hypothetical protein
VPEIEEPFVPAEPEPEAVPVEPAAPIPEPETRAPEPSPPGPKPSPPEPPAASPPAAEPPTEPEIGRPVEVESLAIDDLLEDLDRQRSLVGRLRRLREVAAQLTDHGVNDLRRLLDAFPQGWARRRALACLLERGCPASATWALDLVLGLECELDRAWCLAALLDRQQLSEAAVKAALDGVPSPAWRRRLHRLACESKSGA